MPVAPSPTGGAERRILPISGPYDLRRTLSLQRVGAQDPTYLVADDGIWHATNTPDGAATLRFNLGDDGLVVTAWGLGAAWGLARSPALVGLDDDPSALDPSPEPFVTDVVGRLAGFRMGRSDRVVETLVPTIIAQKVTGAEAKTSYRRLALAFGEPAPGPAELTTPPLPDRLAELGYADFHRFGIERRRAEVVLRACRHADRLERLAETTNEAASCTRLREIPGIGAWTEALVRQRAFGDPDAVPVGDFNLPRMIAWNLRGERQADDSRMLELLAPFTGQRGRVARLVKMGGEKPPRRAPRRRLRSIARY